ncbi:MAG: site-specific integrase [Chloroflexota bacterium]
MTVRHHHAVLRRALNVAVRQRLLAYNPASAVELPEADPGVGMPLTADEARRLLAAAEGDPSADPPVPPDPLRALWRLAIVSGLRQGELLGLAWEDLDGGRLTVRYQMQRLVSDAEREAARREGRKPVGAWVRTAPKAARSVARVALDAGTVAALEAHRVRQAAERTADWRYFGHVFLTPRGDPIHGAELLDAFKAACRRAGIPERRFHDLRGSSATLMRDAGVAEDTRMARLGHSTTEMSRHYAKASEAQDQDAADRLGRALSG